MIPTFDYTEMGFDKILLTADLHFGHEEVRSACKRPWANVDKMDKGLLSRMRSVVGPRDLLIVVGDLTMAGPTRADYVEQIIGKMPGTKVLVFGNHDRFKPQWYLDRGFSLAATALVLPGGVLVVHDPAAATVWPKDRPVLCGHVHDLFRTLGNVVNVGVDVWDWAPITLNNAVGLAAER